MPTFIALLDLATSARARHAFVRLRSEAVTLLAALLQPGKVIADVEAMRALQLEADRIEAAQPVRADMLRRQAACIGLR